MAPLANDPLERDLDADAVEALETAQLIPSGPEKTEALKGAPVGKVADAQGILFAKRGRLRQ